MFSNSRFNAITIVLLSTSAIFATSVEAQTGYSKPVLNRFEAFKLSEGTKVHIGADSQNITLPYGIVATGVRFTGKYKKKDGSIRDFKNEVVTGKDFDNGLPNDLTKLDYSKAVKNGIKRSDYGSDEIWAKEIIKDFESKVKAKVSKYKDFPLPVKEALIDIAWNGGVNSLEWSGIKTYLAEILKPAAERSIANLLAPIKHHKGGGKPLKGLVARRAGMYNLVAADGKKATKVTQKTNSEGFPVFSVYDKDDKLLHSVTSTTKTSTASPDGSVKID